MKSWPWETLALLSYCYALYFELFIVDMPLEVVPMERRIFGSWKKFTFWNLWIQTIYFSMALLVSFGLKALQRPRDFFFFTFALPFGLAVSFFFWVVFNVNRELILPSRVDPFFPPIINHLMHSTMLLFLPIQMLTVKHDVPRVNRLVWFLQFTLCIIYIWWIEYIFYTANFWVYPFLAKFDFWQRHGFMAASSFLPFSLSLICKRVNNAIWGEKSKQK